MVIRFQKLNAEITKNQNHPIIMFFVILKSFYCINQYTILVFHKCNWSVCFFNSSAIIAGILHFIRLSITVVIVHKQTSQTGQHSLLLYLPPRQMSQSPTVLHPHPASETAVTLCRLRLFSLFMILCLTVLISVTQQKWKSRQIKWKEIH